MDFRPARTEDLSIVAGFISQPDELFYVHPTATFPLTAEQLLPNFHSRKGNSVIVVGGQVTGFANYIAVAEGESATIGNVVIDPGQRGTGIGKALLQAMERQAKECYGVTHTIIPCFNTNTYGLHFYHSLGYVPFKGEPRKDQQGRGIFLLYLSKCL